MSIVQEKMYMDVDDVCAILGVSKAYAYNLMREYNKELKAKGYIVVAGKISTKFLAEKIYGMKVEDQQWVFTKKESEIDKKYQKLLETLSQEQEEVITEYCNAIFSSGAETEEFFYRLGLKDGLNLKSTVKLVLESLS